MATRLCLFKRLQAVAQFVENGGAFAKNGINLYQLLMGRDQASYVLPGDFKFTQSGLLLIEGKNASARLGRGLSMNAGEMALWIKIDQ